MTETTGNGVRISNQDIYRKLTEVERDVLSVKQTVDQVVLPTQTVLSRRLDSLEMRVYAILAGLLAAAIGAKGIGLI